MSAYTLITGASGGIGYEFAKVFASHGHSLVLVARSKDALEKLASEIRASNKVSVEVIAMDLSKDESPQELFQKCHEKNLAVDILVNNAGFGDNALFANSDWNKLAEMMDLNVKSLTHLCHLFLPAMLSKKKGAILNLSSVAAFQPGPYMSVYYATKAYVQNFSEALHEEVSAKGVNVMALCPGPTRSGFQAAAGIDSALLLKLPIPSSTEVAEYGYRALKAKKAVAVHGFFNKVLVFSIRLMPRSLVVKIVARMQEKRNQ